MKLLFNIIFVLIAWKSHFVECDELVGALIPKTIHKTQPYTTFIQVYDLENPAELAIQFHRLNRTYSLLDQGSKTFEFYVNKLGMRKSVNLTATLYREKKVRGNLIKQCNSQQREIKVEESKIFVFIQMNKPIYKPGDSVKFRIIIVNKDLLPYQINNINVTITDPYDRIMHSFDDLEGNNIGIFTNTYNLSANTLLGDWKMTVKVDKEEKIQASKIFPIQKYKLPLFALKVDTSSKHYLPNHKLIISFGAKYSFGDYVNGNAKLVIQDTSDSRICFSRTYNNIKGLETATLNFAKDLKINIANLMNFKATVTFTEPETGDEVVKSTHFSVHNSEEMNIKTVHSNTFTPGLPFNVKVFAKKWNGDNFISNEPVRIDIKYTFQNGTRALIQLNPELDANSKANGEVIVPLGVEIFDIECRFISSKVYRKRLKMAKAEQTRNSMVLEYKPEKPSFGSEVEIFASSSYKMEQLLVSVVTKYGVIKPMVVACDDETACSFKFQITDRMLPRFMVEVFHIKDKNINEHGSVSIETETLGMNHLTMEMSETLVKVKSNISLTFNTDEDSTIYLLAIDKSLKNLRDGNDVEREEIVKELSTFDSQSEVLLDDMTVWHECTPDEIKRIETGRVDSSKHSSDTFVSSDDDEMIEDEEYNPDDEGEETESVEPREPTEDELMRQDFPETWIFESFDAEDSETIKVFRVPDTITSWHISAFSINDQSGLAMIDPQELFVKNEFFVKFTLPYSIRYKEILKIDILVFNYVKDNKPLDARVILRNLDSRQFQFVEYDKNGNTCNPKYSTKPHLVKNVKVDGMGMKKVSFYIRSNPNDQNDGSNKIKQRIIQVFADASDNSGNVYKDRIQKKLKIEPVGIRKYNTEAHPFVVRKERKESYSELNVTSGNTNTYCIVNGDFLTDTINLNSKFEIYPGDCLEQRTSKLKGNVQVFKYFQTKGKTPDKNYFSKQYQAIWEARGKRYNYETAAGYISYFIDSVVPAMELKLIKEDKPTIEKELEKLKEKQTSSGNFSDFGNFPDISNDVSRRNTPKYFQTAYVLISLLKAQKFIENKYMDVVNKAFEYLDEKSNKHSVDNEGLSIAAYAYALGMEYDENREFIARGILDEVEKAKIDYGGNRKCFKIKTSSTECHMRHTAFAAMAYLKLGETDKAMPLVYWMLKEYNFYMFQGYTYNTAILSEPIADAAMIVGVNDTNFEVTLKNDNKFVTKLSYKKDNVNDYHEIPLIPNVNKVSMTVDGTGYCSVTRINELMIEESEMIDKFTVTATPQPSKVTNEGIVKVCATYNSTDSQKHLILNVIYEIEFPSGYIFTGIVNAKSHWKDIRQVEERKQKTLALIYFNDFESEKSYCVDVKAMKVHDVLNSRNAGVKVYDFDDKRNVAVEFYEFKSSITC